MFKKIILLFLVCAFALSLVACSNVSEVLGLSSGDSSESGGSTSGSTSSASDNADYEVEKHNAYIGVYNEIVGNVDKVVFDYAEEFGAEDEVYIEDGFTGFTLYSNYLIARLETALEYVEKNPAEPDADAALLALEPVLREYATALDEAKKYYGDKNFVDDDFARSQELHTLIIGGYETFWNTAASFLTAVDVMLEGQDEEALAAYMEADAMIHYYALLGLIQAQEIDAYLYVNDITVENILDLNLDEFRPLYDAFVATYNEYDAIKDDDERIKAEGLMSLMTYSMDMQNLKSSLSELVLRVQNGEAFSSSFYSSAFVHDGTPENISSGVDKLLGNYNTWIV